MASSADAPMYAPVPRPSSWPVRRERRRAAQLNLKEDLCCRLDRLENRLVDKMEQMMDEFKVSSSHHAPLVPLPLGCNPSSVDTTIAEKLVDLDERLSRLASLVFCIPDLKAMDRDVRQCAQSGMESSGTLFFCPTVLEEMQPEPDMETSPKKNIEFDMARDDSDGEVVDKAT